MSHLFGDLLSQYLHRRHGLSQSKLAAGIMQQPAIITYMCKGERLTGPQARERVLAIITWLHANSALQTLDEANALLTAAGMASLRQSEPLEVALTHKLIASPTSYKRSHPTETLPAQSSFRLRLEYPLVGRQVEWQTLHAAWQRAQHGEAHLVCITGEAGIGKTRLAEELLTNVQRQGHIVVYTRVYALEGRLAYAPIADWLRSPPLRARISALDAVWRSEIARLLPELMIEDKTLPTPQPMTERWQLKRLFEALLQVFVAKDLPSPVLLVLDDLQWCDSETLDWLQYLLTAAPTLKFLIVGTVRDTDVDSDHPLHKLYRNLLQVGQMIQLALTPLSRVETTTLGETVIQRTLDTSAAERLFDNCAGNPLFVVESVRFHHGQQYAALASKLQPESLPSLPPKVYAVIHARLARLSPVARGLVELAAVIGRTFTFPFLTQVSKRGEEEVAQGLDELYQRRLLASRGLAQYDFSHDRIRDVAYAEISPARRSLLHRSVAQTLEAVHSEQIDAIAGELAGHYQQAHDLAKALSYFQQAAEVAERLYAHYEALHYLQRAIDIVHLKPDDPTFRYIEIDLWQALGHTNAWINGHGSATQGEPWIKAQAAAMRVGTAFQRTETTLLLASFSGNQGRIQACLDYSQQAMMLAQEAGDAKMFADATITYGRALYHSGNFDQALICLKQAVSLIENLAPTGDLTEPIRLHTGTLIRVAKCLWHLGFPDQAIATTHKMLKELNQQPNIPNRFAPLDFASQFFSYMRNYELMRKLGEELIELSTAFEFPFFRHSGEIYVGWAIAQLGDANKGVALVRESVRIQREGGSRMFAAYNRGLLADVLAMLGDLPQALDEIDTGLAYAVENNNVFWNAHLLKLKGDYLYALGAPDRDVEGWYRHSLSLAQSQNARLLQLRTTMSLAKLWQKQNRQPDAFRILDDIYSGFTEGFNTPDLKEAKALMDETARG